MEIIKNNISKIQTCPSCGSQWKLEKDEEELDICPCCGTNICDADRVSDPKTETIQAVMNELDFDRIHKVMMYLDWKWAMINGNPRVPTIEEIKKQAEELLSEAWDRKCSMGTGGFMVDYEKETDDDYPVLTISFQLTWGGPCWVNKDSMAMRYA